MDPLDRTPMSPQLALRVATIGGVALVLFAIILFRLWYLQVLSGPQYVQLANINRVRDVPIQAPRGDIVDRDGNQIVGSRQAVAVQIDQSELPAGAAARAVLYTRLGKVIGMSAPAIRTIMHSNLNVPYADVTIKLDAGERALVELEENQSRFPGVVETPVYARAYKYGDLAAQVLGNVGSISPGELKEPRFKGVPETGVVGQGGLELEYDQFLRGKDGVQRVQVDSEGQPTGKSLHETLPTPGHELKLSLDLGLEREGYQALQTGEGLAQSNGNAAGAGAFVALDPRNGQVLAMGSLPSYNPTIYTHPVTPAEQAELSSPTAPLLNRATDGAYPTGSTFKLVTAMAALQDGLTTASTPFDDTGCITVGRDHEKFCNAGNPPEVLGSLTMPTAIQKSSDLYFFTLGEDANPKGPIIQSWARKFGFGRSTGIDLPGEFAGVVPDAAWLKQVEAQQYRCLRKYGKRGPQICGYISDPTRTWVTGDNMHFAIGQGDFLATPLQLAVAYSTLFENGRVPTPHLGLAIDDNDGRLIQKIDPPPARTIKFDQANQQVIEDGLHAAAQSPGGTSYDVFGSFPRKVYGKTGTAQHAVGSDDQAWYVAYAPDPKRPIVIAMTIEKGGFGDQSAAPAVRLMLSQWFGLAKQVVKGSSQTL
jgi:penicillin-binding protein 2